MLKILKKVLEYVGSSVLIANNARYRYFDTQITSCTIYFIFLKIVSLRHGSHMQAGKQQIKFHEKIINPEYPLSQITYVLEVSSY